MRKKFLGSMLGAALGDAIGQAIGNFGENPQKVEEYQIQGLIHLLPELKYTDDTHMTIGVAESLIARRGFDGVHMAQCFICNYNQEPWRGYASGPPMIFKLIENGTPWDKASTHVFNGGSFGNGAAMRISPVGLFFQDNYAQLVEAVYHSSRITHAHPLGIEGATLQAMAVSMAVQEDPTRPLDKQSFISQILGFATQDIYCAKIDSFTELLSNPDNRQKIIEQLGHGVEAFNSVPIAIFAFLANSQSFTSTIVYAISLGGDTDTITSMAGAIAGAYLGVDAIPTEWLTALEKKDYISSLAYKLWQVSSVQLHK